MMFHALAVKISYKFLITDDNVGVVHGGVALTQRITMTTFNLTCISRNVRL